MQEKICEPFDFLVTYVHEDGCHIVGLKKIDKKVIFLNVANAEKSCIGETIKISSARHTSEVECPPKFYRSYGILDPHTYGWKFMKLITGTVVFAEPPPFRPIPLAREEERQSKSDSMSVGSIWTNGKSTWVIKDTHLERLAGQERLRVWVTDLDGKRGQALYADSIMSAYKRVSKDELVRNS